MKHDLPFVRVLPGGPPCRPVPLFSLFSMSAKRCSFFSMSPLPLRAPSFAFAFFPPDAVFLLTPPFRSASVPREFGAVAKW